MGQALKVEKLAGLVSLTVHAEIDDTLGYTIDIGSHAAVGSMVARPGAHDGNDGAVRADVDVVCRVALGEV